MTTLTKEFDNLIARSVKNDFDDNFDFHRFRNIEPIKVSTRSPGAFRAFLAQLAMMTGIGYVAYRERKRARAFLSKNIHNIRWLYDHLHERESRSLLIQLLTYGILGHRRVKLPLNTPEYWKQFEALHAMTNGAAVVDTRHFKLSRVNLEELGYPLKLFIRPSGIMAQMILQQYRCVHSEGTIEVEIGNTVIDAGGCWGDSALYFAHKAGTSGKVYSFEFLPEND